jgi:hypothetical protein
MVTGSVMPMALVNNVFNEVAGRKSEMTEMTGMTERQKDLETWRPGESLIFDHKDGQTQIQPRSGDIFVARGKATKELHPGLGNAI